MYLKVENIKPHELERVRKMFGRRLTASDNVYFLACLDQIMNALDNNLEEEELNAFMNSEFMGTELSIMTNELYDEYSREPLDELYMIATNIVEEWREENDR